jgi:CheY-like chemotaxis protein
LFQASNFLVFKPRLTQGGPLGGARRGAKIVEALARHGKILAYDSKTGMAPLGQMRSHYRNGSRAIRNVEMNARKLVVVLDDDAAMLHAIERGLHVHGYDTAGFSEVPDCLSSAGLDEATCLVLDINLKQASGIDVACQLKRMGHAVPVIFITASDSEKTRRAAIGAGCIAYLTKPFRLENLVKAIEQKA